MRTASFGCLVSCAVLMVLACFSKTLAGEYAIVPYPSQITDGSGAGADIGPGSRIVVLNRSGLFAARYLQKMLRKSTGLDPELVVSGTPKAGDITFDITDASQNGDDAYRLNVGNGIVSVRAGKPGGLLYGGITVWQMLSTHHDTKVQHLHAVDIVDYPRFAWRGLMLDSARHMQTVAYIKEFLDWMALHKLNRFHWHLSDDQGWRVEIRRYPRLTEVGAWRKAVWPDRGQVHDGKPGLYGGYYTQAQIRDIVAYAAERNIVVVPEFDMPGHATALIASYPELGVPGFPAEPVASDWGFLPETLNVDEKTIATVEDILSEVMTLFPGRYIHLGGDEVDKGQWHASAEVQARMHALGIHDEEALERWFVSRLSQFLKSHGRRLVGWDEIQEGKSQEGLDPNAVVMSWHGGSGAAKAVANGHDVIIAQAPVYYLDNIEVRSFDEPPAWSDIISMKRIYQNDPVPAGLSPADESRVLGLQGQMWTERIRKQDWISKLVYPRAAAIAEVGWSPKSHLSWEDFSMRMKVQEARYREIGLDAQVLDPKPFVSPKGRITSLEMDFCDANRTGLVLEAPSGKATDSKLVRFAFRSSCWLDHRVDLTGMKRIRIGAVHLPLNERLHSNAPVAHFATPHSPDGEIEIHLDRVDGPLLLSIPQAPFARGDARHEFSAELVSPGGVHDLYFVVTGHDIDTSKPERRPLTAIDWVELH